MHARTHAHTRSRTRTPHRPCSLYRCAQSARHGWAHRFRRWRDNGRSVIHWNKQHAGDSVLTIGLVFFTYKTNSRPNWDANSWQDMLSDDTISLRHLPRRSSKNCDLHFANNDRFKANYSIDVGLQPSCHMHIPWYSFLCQVRVDRYNFCNSSDDFVLKSVFPGLSLTPS